MSLQELCSHSFVFVEENSDCDIRNLKLLRVKCSPGGHSWVFMKKSLNLSENLLMCLMSG